MFAFHQAKATTSTATGECCPCCPSSAPNDGQTPAKNPTVPGSFTCCCADRHATVPETSSVEQVDTGVVLALPPLDTLAPSTGDLLAVVSGTDLPPPTPHLHLLNCVWLC